MTFDCAASVPDGVVVVGTAEAAVLTGSVLLPAAELPVGAAADAEIGGRAARGVEAGVFRGVFMGVAAP